MRRFAAATMIAMMALGTMGTAAEARQTPPLPNLVKTSTAELKKMSADRNRSVKEFNAMLEGFKTSIPELKQLLNEEYKVKPWYGQDTIDATENIIGMMETNQTLYRGRVAELTSDIKALDAEVARREGRSVPKTAPATLVKATLPKALSTKTKNPVLTLSVVRGKAAVPNANVTVTQVLGKTKVSKTFRSDRKGIVRAPMVAKQRGFNRVAVIVTDAKRNVISTNQFTARVN